MNLSKDPRFTLETDEEMQDFLREAAMALGVETTSAQFGRDLARQKGAGEAWKDKVVDTNRAAVDVDTHALTSDPQVLGKLKEIVNDRGRGHHGNTRLSGSNGDHLHWRAGSLRIFGTVNPNGTFTLVGVGRHAGSDTGHYKLDLVTGGKCTADTI